jgi:signal peptidase I
VSYEPTPPELTPLDRQNVVSLDLPAPSPARRFLIETLQTIGLALILFLAINFVSARIRVDGQSMEPSFHDGDYVIVNRLAYRNGEYKRGDVVVFPYPLDREDDFIKRVIGLPGDRIAIQGGDVYVNGEVIQEDYLAEPTFGNEPEFVVPEGHVYVMGDNRNDSSDSRVWGALSEDEIIGKAIFRYWPIFDMGTVQHAEIVVAAP